MGHGLKRLDMIFQLCHVRQEGMIVVFLYSCTPSQWCVALGFNSRRWIYLSSVSGGAFYSWNNFKLMAMGTDLLSGLRRQEVSWMEKFCSFLG
ncbi:uncharacterized protein isoform X4 [Danio rerio]|uniref:Uncharacterized protein isoform X4 n=1 Tax=Danio rerio TaxID=7955 RepID=A0AC58JF77_DANRE|nr:uncharacterized protein LOC101884392 isoform X3 [Danio rerio]|eukprot:XP_021331261.1 uncharacterized protein LOC101884392 isoform X3 [Danio rerio]